MLPEIVGLVSFVLLIFLQKDFSTGMFVFLVGILMFFTAGAKLSWLGPFALLAIPAAILMISIEPYRISRVAAFINPDEFTQTAGYQQFASERAISSGGFWGQGLGSGLSRINSIPEVQADLFCRLVRSNGLFRSDLLFHRACVLCVARVHCCATTLIVCRIRYIGSALMIVLQSL